MNYTSFLNRDNWRSSTWLNLLRMLLCFFVLAYYLIPRTYFSVLGWTLAYQAPISSTVCRCVCSVVYCVGSIIAIAVVSAEANAADHSLRVKLSDCPWLPVVIWFVPLGVSLFQWRQYPDFVMPICSIILSFCTGVMASLISGGARNAMRALLFIVVVQGVYSLYYRSIMGNVIRSGSLWREGGTFDDPNALAILSAVGLAVGLVQVTFSYERGGQYVLFALASAVSGAALLSTFNRGATLAVTVAMIWFSARQMTAGWARWLIIVFMCSLVFFVQFERWSGRDNAASSNLSAANRIEIWRQAAIDFGKHCISGNGVRPVMAIHIQAPTSKSAGRPVDQTVDGPKSVLLYFVDQFGLAGALPLLLGFSFVRKSFVSRAPKSVPEDHVIATAWVAVACYSLVDTAFGGPTQYCGNAIVGYLYASTILLTKKCSTGPDAVLPGPTI